MKLSRRDFLKGLSATIGALLFWHKAEPEEMIVPMGRQSWQGADNLGMVIKRELFPDINTAVPRLGDWMESSRVTVRFTVKGQWAD